MLIAACDTFRAGAVEQLRTHKRKLNALHPASAHGGRSMVELYEKGYGKDAAGIAMEAVNSGMTSLRRRRLRILYLLCIRRSSGIFVGFEFYV